MPWKETASTDARASALVDGNGETAKRQNRDREKWRKNRCVRALILLPQVARFFDAILSESQSPYAAGVTPCKDAPQTPYIRYRAASARARQCPAHALRLVTSAGVARQD